jgi:SAM-dependent methyltransferase
MELDKDLPLFSIIHNQLELLKNNDTNEMEISFYKAEGSFTEFEFHNFTNVCRSFNCKESIDNEYLEITGDNNILHIEGIANIMKYCTTDTFDNKKTKWNKIQILNANNIDGLFDVNFSVKIKNVTEIVAPDNWEDMRKTFRLLKNIRYISNKDKNIEYIASLLKTTDDDFYTLKQSNILKNPQNYTFSLKFKNKEYKDNEIIENIIFMLQAITMSTSLLTKIQQQEVLDSYYKLVKNDIEITPYNKKSGDIPLLAPKPITLERTNLIDPKQYGAVSVLSGYTVTEKADGERILLYVNNSGKAYLINNTYKIEDTGIVVSQAGYNSLIDGEFILCNKRKDDSKKHLYAAFDMYYLGGKKLTSMPLIGTESRYNYLQQFEKLLSLKQANVDFIVKQHKHSVNILQDCKDILTNSKLYPYDIDGLIFTPAKLAVYSYYTNNPVKITDNVKWDRVFKWKPDSQNTIDFLSVINKTITKNGFKYKEIKLYVGYNASQWEDIDINKGLKLRYDKEFSKQNRPSQNSYVPTLFRPTIYYAAGLEYAHIKQNSKGEIRAENGDKIENNSIVEFRYINDINIPVNERWVPIRVREDKTRIYEKGILSKTANDLGVALNIWRSIHNPVTTAMIMGNEAVFNKEAADNADERLLDSDDVYYSRNIPRDCLLSVHMLNFHNQGIKKQLYDKPAKKGTLLELCCGEAGDLNRWIDSGFSFILGIDLVKRNIYNPKSGCYTRMLKRRGQYMRNMDSKNKTYFPDMVFVAGDCSKPIKSGEAAAIIDDKESEDILKKVMNRQSSVASHLKYIVGKGADGFDAISCMFAIHYFFENEEKLDGFLQNVAQNLKKNGVFFCTFMNGETVEKQIMQNGGDMIVGKKLLDHSDGGMPVWAIVRRYNKDVKSPYGKKIDVYIENTQKFIPEYLVSYKLLIDKTKEHGLELVETEMFEETFNKLKTAIPAAEEDYSHLDNDIINLDKDSIQKQFSFLNQYCVFKKI